MYCYYHRNDIDPVVITSSSLTEAYALRDHR